MNWWLFALALWLTASIPAFIFFLAACRLALRHDASWSRDDEWDGGEWPRHPGAAE
jgi:hypothetical protein